MAATHITPFLILNLGSEMIYVFAQRLDAQKIEKEKATVVLDEIISTFLAKKIISELFQPRPPFTHMAVRQLMENIAHSSLMQLDQYSMDRLWDLVTMIYKWQTTISDDITTVTRKHLSELYPLITNPATLLLLEKAQIQFDEYVKYFQYDDLCKIRKCILVWLQQFNVRVSILLKLGLQNQDGSFVHEGHFDDTQTTLLRNLGTNIYTVQKQNANNCIKEEINMFANQILGETKVNHNFINLNFLPQSSKTSTSAETSSNRSSIENKSFLNIDCASHNTKLQDIFKEMSLKEETESITSRINNRESDDNFTDELLNLISNE